MENLSVGVQLQAKAEDGKPKAQQGNFLRQLACFGGWCVGYFEVLLGRSASSLREAPKSASEGPNCSQAMPRALPKDS